MKNNNDQLSLFDLDEIVDWRKEWQDMPEFIQKDLQSFCTIDIFLEPYWDKNNSHYIENRILKVHFENHIYVKRFGELLGITGVTYQTRILKYNIKDFKKLIKQTVTDKTQSLWYPEAEIERYSNKRYIDEDK